MDHVGRCAPLDWPPMQARTAPGTRTGAVATTAAWAALGIGLVVASLSPPIDDFWLALASAREIARGADPAQAIPLAWTPTIPGALNPQWGAQLILGGPGWLGWGLAVNAALVAIGLLVTVARAARRAPPAAVAIGAFAAFAVLAPHLLVRPQAFSIALFPLALLLLDRWPRSAWLPIAYGLLVVAWANLHGAFVVGQLAAVAWLAGAVWEERRPDRPDRRRLSILGATVVAALVAPLANPAGPALLAYAYGQGTSEVVRAISVEWQPAWPWIPLASLFWLLLAAVVAGRLLRRGGLSAPGLLLGAALALLAATGIRHIPWFALFAAPILARDLAAALAGRPRLERAIGRVGGIVGRRPVAVCVVATALVVALQPLRPSLPAGPARLTADAPVQIADYLALELPEGGEQPILNEQVWGGYLEWRLDRRVRIAVDGRLEIRSRETWAAHFALMRGEGDPAADLERAGVRWAALAHRREALIGVLRAAGWEVVLETDLGLLLNRP